LQKALFLKTFEFSTLSYRSIPVYPTDQSIYGEGINSSSSFGPSRTGEDELQNRDSAQEGESLHPNIAPINVPFSGKKLPGR
jgi:hypothetical protein